jgi:hypothetical protein
MVERKRTQAMHIYVQEWRFNNSETMRREKFYKSDSTAMAGTLRALRRCKPEQGSVVVVYRDGDEIGCLHAGNLMARRKAWVTRPDATGSLTNTSK